MAANHSSVGTVSSTGNDSSTGNRSSNSTRDYNYFLDKFLSAQKNTDEVEEFELQLSQKLHQFKIKNFKNRQSKDSNVRHKWTFRAVLIMLAIALPLALATKIALSSIEDKYAKLEKLCAQTSSSQSYCDQGNRTQAEGKDKSDILKIMVTVFVSILTFSLTQFVAPGYRRDFEQDKKRRSIISILEADAQDTLEWYGISEALLVLFADDFVDEKFHIRADWKTKLSSSFCVDLNLKIIQYIEQFKTDSFNKGNFLDNRPYLTVFGDFIGRHLIVDTDFWLLDETITKRYVTMLSGDDSLKSESNSINGESYLQMIEKTADFERYVKGLSQLKQMFIEQLEKTIEFKIAMNEKENSAKLDKITVINGFVAQAKMSSKTLEQIEKDVDTAITTISQA